MVVILSKVVRDTSYCDWVINRQLIPASCEHVENISFKFFDATTLSKKGSYRIEKSEAGFQVHYTLLHLKKLHLLYTTFYTQNYGTNDQV